MDESSRCDAQDTHREYCAPPLHLRGHFFEERLIIIRAGHLARFFPRFGFWRTDDCAGCVRHSAKAGQAAWLARALSIQGFE